MIKIEEKQEIRDGELYLSYVVTVNFKGKEIFDEVVDEVVDGDDAESLSLLDGYHNQSKIVMSHCFTTYDEFVLAGWIDIVQDKVEALYKKCQN